MKGPWKLEVAQSSKLMEPWNGAKWAPADANDVFMRGGCLDAAIISKKGNLNSPSLIYSCTFGTPVRRMCS